MSKLVLGLSSSPRRGANTDAVVKEVLAEAADAGARTRFVNLSGLDISGCRGCYACRKGGRCIIDDDMQRLYALLKKADAWVIGTPVYWFTMSSWLKAPLDRLFAFASDPKGSPVKGKRAAVVTLSGDAEVKAMGGPIFDAFAQSFEFLGVKFAGRLALQGVEGREVRKRWAGYKPARALGARLAK